MIFLQVGSGAFGAAVVGEVGDAVGERDNVGAGVGQILPNNAFEEPLTINTPPQSNVRPLSILSTHVPSGQHASVRSCLRSLTSQQIVSVGDFEGFGVGSLDGESVGLVDGAVLICSVYSRAFRFIKVYSVPGVG